MDEPSSTVTIGTQSTADTPASQPYLLIITRDHARQHTVEQDGVFVLGRALDADILVEDDSVSRQHARLQVSDNRIVLEDLHSHNGTRINGRKTTGEQRLVAGDVVALGDATVIVRASRRGVRRAVRLSDADALMSRLDQEVERAMRFDRPLSVIVVDLGGPVDPSTVAELISGPLAVINTAGFVDAATLLVLLPEVGIVSAEAQSASALETLSPIAPTARAGVASCPRDGSETAALIEAARSAVPDAGVGRAHHAAQQLAVYEATAVVADPAMLRIYELLKRLAHADLPVLVSGETGVGKELAARALHAWSPSRAQGPFVAVNCAALPDTLIESELFGHVRGAFTGADRNKLGYVQAAHGGTLFLDEVGELSPSAQAKLLRALDAGEVIRVGDTKPISVDIRVVAATNRDLQREISADRFRNDLFYRLSAATVVIPPLRDRPRDIPALAHALLRDICAGADRAPMRLSDATMRSLLRYSFPGNVRELTNIMRYAVATANDDTIEPWNLPGSAAAAATDGTVDTDPSTSFRSLADEVADLEKRRMQEALDATGGNQTRAASLIGMPRRTFTTKLSKYGLRHTADPTE